MSQLEWQKSSFSGDSDTNCVELATSPAAIHLRESDNPEAIVRTTPDRLSALLRHIKAGALDRPAE